MKAVTQALVASSAIFGGFAEAKRHYQRASNSSFNVLDYVDPLIGSANGGQLGILAPEDLSN